MSWHSNWYPVKSKSVICMFGKLGIWVIIWQDYSEYVRIFSWGKLSDDARQLLGHLAQTVLWPPHVGHRSSSTLTTRRGREGGGGRGRRTRRGRGRGRGMEGVGEGERERERERGRGGGRGRYLQGAAIEHATTSHTTLPRPPALPLAGRRSPPPHPAHHPTFSGHWPARMRLDPRPLASGLWLRPG